MKVVSCQIMTGWNVFPSLLLFSVHHLRMLCISYAKSFIFLLLFIYHTLSDPSAAVNRPLFTPNHERFYWLPNSWIGFLPVIRVRRVCYSSPCCRISVAPWRDSTSAACCYCSRSLTALLFVAPGSFSPSLFEATGCGGMMIVSHPLNGRGPSLDPCVKKSVKWNRCEGWCWSCGIELCHRLYTSEVSIQLNMNHWFDTRSLQRFTRVGGEVYKFRVTKSYALSASLLL